MPNLTSAEFAFSVGAEFDRCRVVLYPIRQLNELECNGPGLNDVGFFAAHCFILLKCFYARVSSRQVNETKAGNSFKQDKSPHYD